MDIVSVPSTVSMMVFEVLVRFAMPWWISTDTSVCGKVFGSNIWFLPNHPSASSRGSPASGHHYIPKPIAESKPRAVLSRAWPTTG